MSLRRGRTAAPAALVATLLLLASAVAPSVSAASAARSADRVRGADLSLSRTAAIRGEVVSMTATVSEPVRRPVALQRETRRGWDTVATARTDRTGTHVFDLGAPRATTSYRVRAKAFIDGDTAWAPERSPVRTLTVQDQWTKVFARTVSLVTGEEATFTAELAPTRAGRVLRLQVRTDDGWRTLARQVQDDRFFTFTVLVEEAGTRSYRTRAEPWDGASAVVSGVLRLTARG